MTTTHTTDANLIHAVLASEDFVLFTPDAGPDAWQTDCAHPACDTSTNSEGETRCHLCGLLFRR